MLKGKKKLPHLPNLSLEKDDELQLLLPVDGTSQASAFVAVRVGLYKPTQKGTKAVLLVSKSSKEAIQLPAPFRVVSQASTPSGVTDFRVIRDAVPETRVPGICLVFSAQSPIVASHWIGALSTVGAAEDEAAAAASPRPRFSGTVDPIVNVVNAATWQRFSGGVDLRKHKTVLSVLDFVVNRTLKDVPTAYHLCYSQPVAGTMLASPWPVADSGPAALETFAGETLFLVPRQDLGKVDAFALWLEQLAHPSAVVALRKWQASTEEQQRELLRSIETTTLFLRDDSIRRLLSYADVHGPAIALDRMRLHDVGESLPLVRCGSPRSEAVHVTNNYDRPVMLCMDCPLPSFGEGVAIFSTPEIIKVLPRETKEIRFDLHCVSQTPIEVRPRFLRFFTVSTAQAKDKRIGQVRVEGSPVVIPLALTNSGPAASALPQQPAIVVRTSSELVDFAELGQISLPGVTALVRKVSIGEPPSAQQHTIAASVSKPLSFGLDLDKMQCIRHSTLLLPFSVLDPEEARPQLLLHWPAENTITLGAAIAERKLSALPLQLKIALDVATALRCAHVWGLVHGAVAPERVLVTQQSFQLAKFDASSTDNAVLVGSWLGLVDRAVEGRTPYFNAPELSDPAALPTPESDVFSFGMLLFSLVSGTLPFSELPKKDYDAVPATEAKIRAGLRPSFNLQPSGAIVRLINDCWVTLPEHRPTMNDVVRRLYLALCALAEPQSPSLGPIPRIMQFSYGRMREGSFAPEQPDLAAIAAAAAASSSHMDAPPSPSRGMAAPPPPPPAVPAPSPMSSATTATTVVFSITRPGADAPVKLRMSRKTMTAERIKKLACLPLHIEEPEKCVLVNETTKAAITTETALEALCASSTPSGVSLSLLDESTLVNASLAQADPNATPVFAETLLFKRDATCANILGTLLPPTALDIVALDDNGLAMDAAAMPLESDNAIVKVSSRATMKYLHVKLASDTGKEIALYMWMGRSLQTIVDIATTRWRLDPSHCFLFSGESSQKALPLDSLLRGFAPRPGRPYIEFTLLHFEPVTLRIRRSAGGDAVDVVMTQGLAVSDAVQKALQAFQLHAEAADAHVLAVLGTGAIVHDDTLDTEKHGLEYVLVSKADVVVYDILSPSSGTVPDAAPLAQLEFAPGCTVHVRELLGQLPAGTVLIDGIDGVEAQADEVVTPDSILLGYAAHSAEIVAVRVGFGGHAWEARALSRAAASTVREHACKALQGPEDALLLDGDGCIVDDLVALASLPSTAALSLSDN